MSTILALKTENLREVVSERKLYAVIVRCEAVLEILTPSPLEFPADNYVFDRVIEQVGEAVLAAMVRIGRLAAGVFDVHQRISDRGAEFLVPVVIQERDDSQHRKSNAFDRPDGVSRIEYLDAHINRGIVHVVFNTFPVDYLKAANVVFPELDIRAHCCSPSDVVSTEVKLIINCIDPSYAPDYSGNLNVPPIAIEAHVPREVWEVEPWSDALQLDSILKYTLIAACARPFDRDCHRVLSFERHPAKLHIAEENHSVWTPVLDRVGKHIDIHERTPILSRSEMAELTIGVSQPECGLSRIDAGAVQLELELGL